MFNIGSANKFSLAETIHVLEELMGEEARLKSLPEQRGDMRHTFAEINKAREALDYRPQVRLRDGLKRQIEWLRAA